MDTLVSFERTRSTIVNIIGYVIGVVLIVIGIYLLFKKKYWEGSLLILVTIGFGVLSWVWNYYVQTNDTFAKLSGVNTITTKFS
jgi:hypothetical protein